MFFDTLPIIFTYSQLFEPFDLLIVFSSLFAILYISSPFPADERLLEDASKYSLYQYLLRAWCGEWVLVSIFWPFFLIMNGALLGADYLVKTGIISVSSWGNIHMMLGIPVIWWTVAVWRGSDRAKWRCWSACARLAVVGVYFELGLRLYIRIELPRIFFVCEELLLDYFKCF